MVKTVDRVTAQKLRGGFYSPSALVKVCFDRVAALMPGVEGLSVLEPSAGDGAFVRGIDHHELRNRVASVTAVELLGTEAAVCRGALADAALGGTVRVGSFLNPITLFNGEKFDAAVGNPPFLRFQFVAETDRPSVEILARKMGVMFKGVSNLWIPVFLGSLLKLRIGGAFAFIIPSECLTGISGRVVRNWLIRQTENLQIDLFPVDSFPGVLQEVIVLSGTMTPDVRSQTKIAVFDHASQQVWTHVADEALATWTGLLLSPKHLAALDEVAALKSVLVLGDVARIGVATVTGANEFFSLDDQRRKTFGLTEWSRPMLTRVRQAAGLDFTTKDFEANSATGTPAWLFDAGLSERDPICDSGPSEYISQGEAAKLHEGYKCSIRTPWYRVPTVKPGNLMLSKRSHRFPRLIQNSARVVTTDTIYQGSMTGIWAGRERDLVGSFHNSLTLFTAEMFGRSFGGGVLELVPSEVKSLLVPLVSVSESQMNTLDKLVRNDGFDSETLVEQTDALVQKKLSGLTDDLLATIRDAREILMLRRLARN